MLLFRLIDRWRDFAKVILTGSSALAVFYFLIVPEPKQVLPEAWATVQAYAAYELVPCLVLGLLAIELGLRLLHRRRLPPFWVPLFTYGEQCFDYLDGQFLTPQDLPAAAPSSRDALKAAALAAWNSSRWREIRQTRGREAQDATLEAREEAAFASALEHVVWRYGTVPGLSTRDVALLIRFLALRPWYDWWLGTPFWRGALVRTLERWLDQPPRAPAASSIARRTYQEVADAVLDLEVRLAGRQPSRGERILDTLEGWGRIEALWIRNAWRWFWTPEQVRQLPDVSYVAVSATCCVGMGLVSLLLIGLSFAHVEPASLLASTARVRVYPGSPLLGWLHLFAPGYEGIDTGYLAADFKQGQFAPWNRSVGLRVHLPRLSEKESPQQDKWFDVITGFPPTSPESPLLLEHFAYRALAVARSGLARDPQWCGWLTGGRQDGDTRELALLSPEQQLGLISVGAAAPGARCSEALPRVRAQWQQALIDGADPSYLRGLEAWAHLEPSGGAVRVLLKAARSGSRKVLAEGGAPGLRFYRIRRTLNAVGIAPWGYEGVLNDLDAELHALADGVCREPIRSLFTPAGQPAPDCSLLAEVREGDAGAVRGTTEPAWESVAMLERALERVAARRAGRSIATDGAVDAAAAFLVRATSSLQGLVMVRRARGAELDVGAMVARVQRLLPVWLAAPNRRTRGDGLDAAALTQFLASLTCEAGRMNGMSGRLESAANVGRQSTGTGGTARNVSPDEWLRAAATAELKWLGSSFRGAVPRLSETPDEWMARVRAALRILRCTGGRIPADELHVWFPAPSSWPRDLAPVLPEFAAFLFGEGAPEGVWTLFMPGAGGAPLSREALMVLEAVPGLQDAWFGALHHLPRLLRSGSRTPAPYTLWRVGDWNDWRAQWHDWSDLELWELDLYARWLLSHPASILTDARRAPSYATWIKAGFDDVGGAGGRDAVRQDVLRTLSVGIGRAVGMQELPVLEAFFDGFDGAPSSISPDADEWVRRLKARDGAIRAMAEASATFVARLGTPQERERRLSAWIDDLPAEEYAVRAQVLAVSVGLLKQRGIDIGDLSGHAQAWQPFIASIGAAWLQPGYPLLFSAFEPTSP